MPDQSLHSIPDVALVEASPASTILVDARQPDLPVVYVNPAFETLTGYPREEIIGRNCRFLQGDDRDQEGLKTLRAALRDGEACTVTLRNYRKDGSMFWNQLRVAPLRDEQGQVTHFIGIQDDITAHIRTDTALAHSETRYRQMFDNNHAVQLLIDPTTGQIKDANPAAVEYYGYSRAQLLTMRIQEINVLSPEAVQAEMRRAEAAHQMFFEFRHRLASGEVRDVDVFSGPLDTPDGRYLYSIIVDATERKKAHEREFQIALEKERLRLLTTFIRSTAHEFRTPLAAINLSAYLIARTDDEAKRQGSVQQIQAHVERTTRLVDMLLKMAQLESAKPTLTSVDVAALVRTIGEQWLVSTECGTGSLLVNGNAVLLQEALEALLDNARRFGPAYGVIRLSVRRSDSWIVIDVQDDGPGIAEEKQARIFETFWRDDQSHSTPGLGLGLPIARKIVQMHGGDLTVESALGQGSCFRIWLPGK